MSFFDQLQENHLSVYNNEDTGQINSYTIHKIQAEIYDKVREDFKKLSDVKNIESQSGAILDIIGEDLQFPRNVFDDTDYRLFLNILSQRLYVSSSYDSILSLLRAIPYLSDFSLESNFLEALHFDGSFKLDGSVRLSGATGDYQPAKTGFKN